MYRNLNSLKPRQVPTSCLSQVISLLKLVPVLLPQSNCNLMVFQVCILKGRLFLYPVELIILHHRRSHQHPVYLHSSPKELFEDIMALKETSRNDILFLFHVRIDKLYIVLTWDSSSRHANCHRINF